jgi:LacI family transcriptional regulator
MATSRTTDAEREAAVGEHLRILAEHGARVVIIGDNDLGFPTVTVDNHRAARLLADGLVRAGRTRFAILSAPVAEITARDRVEGFLEGLADHGIVVDERDIVHTEFSREGGYNGVGRIGDRIGDFDVIAAMSDAMAVGAIARLRELGIAVPRDIEVTGFDHVPMLGDVLQDFSTVEVPLERFGPEALALALDDGGSADTRISLQATPIVHGEAANLV